MKEILISNNEGNQRLDRYLTKLMPEASKGFLQKMLRKKRIKLNGQKSEPNQLINVGDKIQIYFSEETIAGFRPEPQKLIPRNLKDNSLLDIIFEDKHLLILNKPTNLLTQPDKTEEDSLIDIAVSYLIQSGAYNPKENLTFTPACSNRLDKNTTGVVIIPKDFPSLQKTNEAIREGKTKKIYYALVHGILPETGEIKGYLKKDPVANLVTFSETKTQEKDKKAELTFTKIASKKGISLVAITLLTGRSHQIRAQFSALGFPILGDPKYGNRHSNIELYEAFGLKSQLLHNYSFTLTTTDQTFIAPFPLTFQKILRSQGFSEDFLLEV